MGPKNIIPILEDLSCKKCMEASTGTRLVGPGNEIQVFVPIHISRIY